jgi:uncharacterized membrane protein
MLKKLCFVFLFSMMFTLTAKAEAFYEVTNVAADDYLNVRSEAGVQSLVVTRIPYDAKAVVLTGQKVKQGNSTWVKIVWQGKEGWVNQSYLRPVALSAESSNASSAGVKLRCGGTEPFWGIDVTSAQAKYKPMDGAAMDLPITFRGASANNPTIAVIKAEAGDKSLGLFLQKVSACSDGMSDINYPYTITALINGNTVYSGCCHQQ